MNDEYPFMQLFVRDELAEVADLDACERGALWSLRDGCWLEGGELPADPRRLARRAGVDLAQWETVWGVIGRFFETGDGVIRHPGVIQGLARAKEQKAKRREGADKTNAKRAAQRGAERPLSDSQGDTPPSPSPDPSPSGSPPPPPAPAPRRNPSGSSAEPVDPAPADGSAIVFRMPMSAGRSYSITEQERASWQSLYPAVDVQRQLERIGAWLKDNPEKKSAKPKGVRQRIDGWLNREQKDAGPLRNGQGRATLSGRRDVRFGHAPPDLEGTADVGDMTHKFCERR